MTSVDSYRLVRATSVSVLSLVLVAVSIGVFGATHLRMTNDDYWHAYVARLGFLGAMREWWLTTSGDLIAMASNTLLNGLPLLHFPWPLTSSVPHMIAFLVVGLTCTILLGVTRRARFRQLFFLGAGVLTFGFLWWVFLWTPLAFGGSARLGLILGITHWQNLNTAYIIPPALLLVGWLLLWRSRLSSARRGLLGFLLGLAVGLAGLVLGFSTIAWLFSAGIVSWLARKRLARQRIVQTISTATGALVGLTLSLSAPGSRDRAAGYGIDSQAVVSRAFDTLVVFPQGLQDVLQSLWHAGALVVVLIVLPIAALLASVTSRQNLGGLEWNKSILLLSFALMDATVSRLAQIWIGPSWWHTTTLQLLVFLAVVTASWTAGLAIGTKLTSGVQLALSVTAISGCLVGIGVIQTATQIMIERENEWSQGPAIVEPGAQDINDVNGWQLHYWERIVELRDAPDRMGFLREQ